MKGSAWKPGRKDDRYHGMRVKRMSGSVLKSWNDVMGTITDGWSNPVGDDVAEVVRRSIIRQKDPLRTLASHMGVDASDGTVLTVLSNDFTKVAPVPRGDDIWRLRGSAAIRLENDMEPYDNRILRHTIGLEDPTPYRPDMCAVHAADRLVSACGTVDGIHGTTFGWLLADTFCVPRNWMLSPSTSADKSVIMDSMSRSIEDGIPADRDDVHRIVLDLTEDYKRTHVWIWERSTGPLIMGTSRRRGVDASGIAAMFGPVVRVCQAMIIMRKAAAEQGLRNTIPRSDEDHDKAGKAIMETADMILEGYPESFISECAPSFITA